MLDMGTISVLYAASDRTGGDEPIPESVELGATASASETFEALDGGDDEFDAVLVDDAHAGSEFVGELLEVTEQPCVLVGDDTDSDALRKTLRTAVREEWTDFPIPGDEHVRLDALARYDFDEPTLQAHLDGLTTTARECFDADVGFVGVVDGDEERFLTAQGVDWQTLDRRDAICSHGLLDGDAFVVSGLADDPRVSYDPIASDAFEPDFYAGIPLQSADGHHIGMLCVMDEAAREFDEEDASALRWLAEQAMVHVERYGRAS